MPALCFSTINEYFIYDPSSDPEVWGKPTLCGCQSLVLYCNPAFTIRETSLSASVKTINVGCD